MKQLLFILIFSCAALYSFAQEKIILDSIPRGISNYETGKLNMELPLNFNEPFSLEQFNQFDPLLFNQPLLPDYNKNLDFKKLLSPQVVTSTYYSFSQPLYYPFYTNGTVFNQATYRINDKLSFGGNSFGAQGIFDKPQVNPAIQNMSTKGASMFMQYKVSKNFKIETRVSVTNHQQSPWGP